MTNIVVYIIGLIAMILGTLITIHVVPWLKARNLYDAAVIAVEAAEALYGRGHGEEKLKAALDSLAERGYDIDSNRVIDAVRAAWKELDQAMYMDGEKKPEI